MTRVFPFSFSSSLRFLYFLPFFFFFFLTERLFNFCDKKNDDHFTSPLFVRIVPTAFRRWIMLVKSDKTAFVLALRSSEKLSFNPFKGRNWEAAAFSLRLFALSSPKWRLHVWLCQLLICRQYVKVAHVSDFHGHPTKGEQIADKGVPFPFSSVVRTTKKYFSDNKFYFKAFLTEGWLLHSFLLSPPPL